MDLTSPLGADFREVRETTFEGRPARGVVATRTYATDIEDLWDALTNAERIPRWFMPISGDLKLGGRYDLEGNASGTITRCDKPTALDLTWEYADNVSWVMLRLETREDSTSLTLEHLMSKDAPSEVHWKQYGPGATGLGWDLSLLGLGLFIDGDGDAVSGDKIDEWATTESGKSFMRQCADEWCSAHIESGENEVTAKAMADECYTAYSGG